LVPGRGLLELVNLFDGSHEQVDFSSKLLYVTYNSVRFEWDGEKNRTNQSKHPGITFEAAQEVFDDPNQVVLENSFLKDEGEQRYQVIGMTRTLLLLLVVFVDRSVESEEIIHIISARKAIQYEEGIYQEQFR
jgi:uncharacterized protein